MFADLVDSTAAAGDQDPERTRIRLERFYDAMAAEIEAAGGQVEKFAGDAVMAAFGAPGALEDHAERALHCALAMQHRLQSLFEGSLALRIGVNTGEVVVGRPREGSSFVSGDAVNVAARLEQAAEPGEVLAGERTVAAAQGAFEFGDPKVVEAKGKPDGVSCRPLVRALSLMRTRGVGGLARAFVGRDDELERVQAAYRTAVEQRTPVLVTVVGDAGVGKTRLMRELWEWLGDEENKPLRRTGRCLAYGQGITYWPLGEVLKEHLGILETDSPDDVLAQLGDRKMLGLTLGLDLAGSLHPLAARDRLHEAWISFLSEQAAQRAVVLLIEDVHWAEDQLLDLIERLARDVAGPLLVLATARPDFVDSRAGWGGPRVAGETILLEPLPTDAAATLVDALAGELPEDVRGLVVTRAEGNPFYVEELLGSLIDRGVLERIDGRWRAREVPADFEVPDSVQAVVAARIDLLAEPEKAALQAAAVIGRTFWTGPVYELVEGLEPDLRLLESRDFIRRRAGSALPDEVEYVFKHALTRDVAYSSVTKARRARLHARFADWIERIGQGRDEHAPLLAYHYAEAVRPDNVDVAWPDKEVELARLQSKALHWLRRSAEAAISRYEIADGIELLKRALTYESETAEQARIWRRIGQAHALEFDGDAFIESMERSLTLVEDPDERAATYADLAFQAASRAGMWQRRPDHSLMEEWTARAISGAEPGSVTYVKGLIGRIYWGLEPEGTELAREASGLAEHLGDLELRSFAWDARALTEFRKGEFENAHTFETRRFDLLDELTDPDHIHDMHISIIPTCVATGRIREARRLAAENDDLVLNLTPHHRLHGAACVLEVEELAGNWERIRELEPRTEDAVAKNRETPCVRNARSLLVCAVAAELLGGSRRSRELEDRASEIEAEGYGLVFTGPRTRLALARGDVGALHEIIPDVEWFRRQSWFALPAAAVRLDALAVIGDEEAVESSGGLLKSNGYLEPFMLRALGIVRGDEQLLAEADRKFRSLRLDWHARQTPILRDLRRRA